MVTSYFVFCPYSSFLTKGEGGGRDTEKHKNQSGVLLTSNTQMNNLPDFLIIPYQLIADKEITPIEEKLYGVIYWFSKLKNEECTASNTTLAKIVKTTAGSIANALTNLENLRYIQRVYKDTDKKVRKEIIPLVVYSRVSSVGERVSSVGERRVSSVGEQKKNTIIRKVKKTSTEQSSGVEIGVLIESFGKINADCKEYYGRKVQRDACDFLIQQYGFNRVKEIIERTLPQTNHLDFFPVITTPVQLRRKWAMLESAVLRKKAELKAKKEKYKVAFA